MQRARVSVALLAFVLLAGVCACAGERPAAPRTPPHAARADQTPAELDAGGRGSKAKMPFAYTLDTAGLRAAFPSAEIGKGRRGYLLDGARIVVGPDGARKIPQAPRINLNALDIIPMHLGGGFLFRTSTALFRASTFEGPLNPVVSFPQSVTRVSFGPQGALVRTYEGDRFSFGLPDWKPAAPAPFGLVDIQSLADGRALASAEFGRIFSTIDRGATWVERGAKMANPPAEILQIEGELWVRDDGGKAYKLDKTGDLIPFDRLPERSPGPKPPPSWHGKESPLRTAVLRGVPLDSTSALVADAGDVWRIDLRTGALLSKIDFTLPPSAACQGVRTYDEIVFICAGNGTSLAVSGPFPGDRLRAERTFGAEGPFFAGDDGHLVLGAPCAPGKTSPFGACVRRPNGEWEDLSLDPSPIRDADSDLGVELPARVARWIPRADALPLAVLIGSTVATHDPLNNKNTIWKGLNPEELIRIPENSPTSTLRGAQIIDVSWTALPDGSLWGWNGTTRSVSVSASGTVQLSPYPFDLGFPAGAQALFRTRDGRLYQSADHGRSFFEVQPPPTASIIPTNQQACSAVGCVLGHWLRVGWPAEAPAAEPEAPLPAPAPEFVGAPLPELVCDSKGEQKSRQLPMSAASPEDFGFGASRIPISGELPNGDIITYSQTSVFRQLWHPLRGDSGGMEGNLRVMVHGFGIEFTDTGDLNGLSPALTVLGPNRSAGAFQRTISFVEAFDPSGVARSVNYGLGPMVSAVRASGNAIGNVLNMDGFNLQGFVPILAAEPGGATEYLFNALAENGEIFGTVGGGSSPKVRFWAARLGNSSPISAVMLSSNEIAVLTLDSDSRERVVSLRPGSISHIFELQESSSPPAISANPDALALGPQKTLAILRTPSGSLPASALDPALLLPVQPQTPSNSPTPLAAWSTITPADDAACKQDMRAFRSIINTNAPWLRVRGGGAVDGVPLMSARVSWSAERVCLEALEIPERTSDLPSGARAETTIVAQFLPKRLASRGFVARGAEMNQPLSCALAPAPAPK